MAGNLIIVESPHKAGQIQGFLGKENYKVVSSKGHIRDLEEKGMSIDIEHGFEPKYVISPGQRALVAQLKKLSTEADTVWLASDPDREGEAIAWHLAQTLGLDMTKTHRITYNEVTKAAVLDAIEHPRGIDMNLVDAQQARRVLDRLVGFDLSPVLWRKIKRGLSAGRVQSVTLRLVVDREREIAAFKPEPYYGVTGIFNAEGNRIKALLDTRFDTPESARQFLSDSIGASYRIADIEKKEGTRCPAPPFTTSTLQQEAARKLHFSSSRTMRIAQGLYEKGLITYMRTDSTNLSSLALGTAKQFISDNYGAEYSHPRNFKTRTKGAQEAHEAIRPTFIANVSVNGTTEEQKLYNLIWKRTVASQMADARVMNTTMKIASDKRSEMFCAQSVEVLFDGFLKLYMEGVDDCAEEEGVELLPPMRVGEALQNESVSASCKFTQAPWRYSEQTLIKKMEELGIGRPSTYAPTLTTLTNGRGYIVTADKPGTPVQVEDFELRGGVIRSVIRTENVGAEKHKLVPTDVGMMVTDYLKENFPDIMDYDFTANVEEDFDKISSGKKEWRSVIGSFYTPFHAKVNEAISNKEYSRVERELGIDPSDGQKVVARFGQYGPYVQKGDGESRVFASITGGQLIETITLEEALKLLALPRNLGKYKGEDVIVTKGRFGPYLKCGGNNVKLPRGTDPLKITLEDCTALIDASSVQKPRTEPIAEYKDSDIIVMQGMYGPYIKHAGANYKIPAGTDPATLTEQACLEIIGNSKPTASKRRFYKKK